MSDKLFEVSVKNHLHYVSDGALNAEFYVVAPDFMSALLKADETVSSLREKLAGHKSLDGLRVCSLRELGDVVDGVAMAREPQTESWAEREARKARTQNT